MRSSGTATTDMTLSHTDSTHTGKSCELHWIGQSCVTMCVFICLRVCLTVWWGLLLPVPEHALLFTHTHTEMTVGCDSTVGLCKSLCETGLDEGSI